MAKIGKITKSLKIGFLVEAKWRSSNFLCLQNGLEKIAKSQHY